MAVTTEQIVAFFTSAGAPAVGLSPTVRIRELATNTLVVTDAAMVEVGDGFYSYDFTAYDTAVNYAIRCDGTSVLSDAERYSWAGNEDYDEDTADAVWDEPSADHVTSETFGAKNLLIEQILRNKLVTDPVTGTMTLYDDAGTPLLTADIFEDTPGSVPYRGQGVERKERLT